MAEALAESCRPRHLHPAHMQHDITKSTHQKPKHDKSKLTGQKANSKLVANHDLIGCHKVKRKSKDLEKSFKFIHGENLFPLEPGTDKRPLLPKRSTLSERKERDLVGIDTKAVTDIKMRVPKIHKPKQKLQNPEKIPPLKDVKRKLDFCDNEQKLDVIKESNGLDFTDKIAALRSLLGTSLKTVMVSEERDIHNTATVSSGYREDHTTSKSVAHKIAQVARSDSLKENGNIIEIAAKRRKRREEARSIKEDVKTDKFNEVGKSTKEAVKNKQLITGVGDSRITDDRLSALTVDLHALKDRLFDKRRGKGLERNSEPAVDRYLDKFIMSRAKRLEKRDEMPTVLQNFEVGDALDHASPNRKIISSTKKFNLETKEHERVIINSKSNLGHKEIQTDILNQSIKSVQSNVPYYEPYCVSLGEAVKRPESALSSPIRKKFESNNIVLFGKEGICEGVNIGKTSEHLENSSHSKIKQTNVDSFVGTSLTPEKDQCKGKIISKDKDTCLIGTNENYGLNKKDEIENTFPNKQLKEPEVDNKLWSEKFKRREKEKKIEAYKHLKSNRREKVTKSDNEEKIRYLESITVNKIELEDDYMDNNFAQRIIESTNKTEKKVREWIKSQEKHEHFYPTDSGPMTLDELSVSPSAETKTKGHQSLSPTDSCDRIPVKLEKWENERQLESNDFLKHNHLNKVLSKRHSGMGPKDMRGIARKMERQSEDFPLKDLPPLKAKHHQPLESVDTDTQ